LNELVQNNDFGLVQYNAAIHALQIAVSIDEVKDIRDKAKALSAYALQAKDDKLLRMATEIKVRAERRCGQMLRDMPKAVGTKSQLVSRGIIGGNTVLPPINGTKTLEEIGISKMQSSRWQKIAAIPDDVAQKKIDAAVELASETLLRGKARATALLHTGDEESYTPACYLDSARRVLKKIDLDPASNDLAQETVKAEKYYTREMDGLGQTWTGRVWINPPYTARVINTFVDKLLLHLERGEVSAGIMLTNNSTDTSWFHKAAAQAAAICFTAGRINFFKPDGSQSSPTNGQVFFYFGNSRKDFMSEFFQYGLVMVNYA
jgi:DNA N-6-adenine-methyltransferase (Dam)